MGKRCIGVNLASVGPVLKVGHGKSTKNTSSSKYVPSLLYTIKDKTKIKIQNATNSKIQIGKNIELVKFFDKFYFPINKQANS